jgi:uracil-DNA glycosylase
MDYSFYAILKSEIQWGRYEIQTINGNKMSDDLKRIHDDLIACTRCPSLRRYCERVARVKRRAYRDQSYWGKPVPGFGDPESRLLIIGLAPAAHGGNRTGRVFTGDRSGDFLFGALYRAGFANRPQSCHRDDGLRLREAYITAALHCAPPGNKPARVELTRCRDYLIRELRLLSHAKVVLALGKIAFDEYLRTLIQMKWITHRRGLRFGHGARYELEGRAFDISLPNKLPILVASFHPSQQNTQTGRLTEAMMDAVFSIVRRDSSFRSKAILP